MPPHTRANLFEEYPKDAAGNPIDTPDWRDSSNIKDCSTKSDTQFVTAVRKYKDDKSLFDAAVRAGADVNATDKVRSPSLAPSQ